MRIGSKLSILCFVCLSCLRISAQNGRNALFSLPPFERAVVYIKHFEGLHGFKDAPYPYVGYGHQLLPGEHFTAAMTERQANFLLLAVLFYCVGAGRLLGYGKNTKSRLLRKIELGDRNFYRDFVSFC